MLAAHRAGHCQALARYQYPGEKTTGRPGPAGALGPAAADKPARAGAAGPADQAPAEPVHERDGQAWDGHARDGQPRLLRAPSAEQLRRLTGDAELAGVLQSLELTGVLLVPLVARRRLLGTLALLSSTSERRLDEQDVQIGVELAGRAALALDNARLYQLEHHAALTLQRSLLPVLPALSGVRASAVYLPGSATSEVGGDWYDVLELPDGSTGLAIGDVMGHDLSAAAAMGQLRSVLRSYAWEGGEPADVLDRLDRLVRGLAMADLATCVYARLHPPGRPGANHAPASTSSSTSHGTSHGTSDSRSVAGRRPGSGRNGAPGSGVPDPVPPSAGLWTLTYANAGHHAPLLRLPDGTVHSLTGGRSVLIGVDPLMAGDGSRPQARVELPAGSTLLLFTDGLVEHRGRDLDEAVAAAQALLAAHPPADGPDALTGKLAERVRRDRQSDDVCLLALTVD